ncbi:MAG: DMT family transporter [Leeuwenhoekiella sp.]
MPKQSAYIKNLLQLNLGVLFISTSGVLGRSIHLWPPVTIGIRALLAMAVLFLFLWWKKLSLRIAKKDRSTVLLGGILMGVHWVTYFQALRLSNVAIGMLTIYTYPAMSSLLEPLILKSKFEKMHLLLGVLVLIGIYFLVPEFSLEHEHTQAIAFGLCSALAYAIRNILMKREVGKYHGSVLMWYQMVIVGFCLLPLSLSVSQEGLIKALPLLLILAVVTTSVGHTVFLMSFRHFKITTASILSSVQPIYGILLAFLLLGERPKLITLLGGSLIILAVIVESLRNRGKVKEVES